MPHRAGDIHPIAKTAIDAANAGDTDAFLEAFGPDGVVDDWGREFEGPDAIKGWSDEEFIGKEVALDVKDVTVDGTETTIQAEVGGQGYNGPSKFSFVVEDDVVKRMTIRG
jgi:hypothetical protein